MVASLVSSKRDDEMRLLDNNVLDKLRGKNTPPSLESLEVDSLCLRRR